MTRKYELKARARKQEETRQRIVEAVVALHEEVGPAQTTIKGIAERAGVQRLTVYRHFPDEPALIEACGAHFLSQNPPPNASNWEQIDDPESRFRTGLADLYGFYARTERMTANILRDLTDVPALEEATRPFMEAIRWYQAVLSEPWQPSPETEDLLQAAVAHAIWFDTWRSLVRHHGMPTEDAIELMTRMVRATTSSN
jgi:AcrR family transcriptional regulator